MECKIKECSITFALLDHMIEDHGDLRWWPAHIYEAKIQEL